MSKRKISTYFQREANKIIDEAEEKTDNAWRLTSEFETSQFPDEMVEWT